MFHTPNIWNIAFLDFVFPLCKSRVPFERHENQSVTVSLSEVKRHNIALSLQSLWTGSIPYDNKGLSAGIAQILLLCKKKH